MVGRKNMIGNKLKATFLLFIIAASIFLIEGSVLAKEPEFRLEIDSLNLKKGTSANLVLSMINVQGGEEAEISGLENFDILSNNQSTSMQNINGDTTYQKDIRYIIMPKSTGQFTLQGSVNYNGKTYQTNDLKINVSEAADVKEDELENLFVKTILPDEIYLGQKAVLAYELYSRYNIEDFGFLDNMSIDGFILSDVPKDDLKANYVELGGNKYIKYDAKQMYLSSIKSGTFSIPEYNFQVNVSTGDFFNSSKPFYLKTKSKQLTVKPLPAQGKPANFSGIVGILNLEASYSRQEVNYGDSLALRVKASGNCNLEALDKIIKDGIPGFSVYETEKDMEERIENNQYKAQKEFEIILVPEKSGEINIDPIYLTYFNTESGTYEQAEISGATITVKGEAPESRTQVQSDKDGGIMEAVKIDQLSYGTQKEGYLIIQLRKDYLLIGLIVLLTLLVLSVLIFLALKYGKKYDKKMRDMYTQLKKCDNKNEIYNIFNSMIKNRYDLSLKASSRDVIKIKLADYELESQVLEVMDIMESDTNNHDKDYTNLKDKIKVIYDKLKFL